MDRPGARGQIDACWLGRASLIDRDGRCSPFHSVKWGVFVPSPFSGAGRGSLDAVAASPDRVGSEDPKIRRLGALRLIDRQLQRSGSLICAASSSHNRVLQRFVTPAFTGICSSRRQEFPPQRIPTSTTSRNNLLGTPPIAACPNHYWFFKAALLNLGVFPASSSSHFIALSGA